MILQFQIIMSVIGGWSVRECFSLLVCSVLYSRLSSRDHQQSAAFSPVSSLVLYGVVDFKQACCIQKGVPLVLLHALFSAKKPSISTCRYFGSSHRLHWEISVDYGWVFQTGILKLQLDAKEYLGKCSMTQLTFPGFMYQCSLCKHTTWSRMKEYTISFRGVWPKIAVVELGKSLPIQSLIK